MWTRIALSAGLIAGLSAPALSAVTYDFTGKGGLFDGETSVDVPLTDSVTGLSTTMTVEASGGTLNSNSGDFGVNAPGSGDTTDVIEDGEAIDLTFDSDIELNSIDFGGIGSDLADGATLTIGTFTIDLFTNVSGFNGNTDVYTPATHIAITAGTPINLQVASSTADFDLETIDISVVPEPGSVALLGLGGLLMLRRRA